MAARDWGWGRSWPQRAWGDFGAWYYTILYLQCGDYTTIYICQNYTLKGMNFTDVYLKISGEDGASTTFLTRSPSKQTDGLPSKDYKYPLTRHYYPYMIKGNAWVVYDLMAILHIFILLRERALKARVYSYLLLVIMAIYSKIFSFSNTECLPLIFKLNYWQEVIQRYHNVH